MRIKELSHIIVEQKALPSASLKRYVIVDIYLPRNNPSLLPPELLLINDGQNLEEMGFAAMLDGMLETGAIKPVYCVGIYAGSDRLNEYGTADVLDYEGRGSRANAYQQFIVEELLPFVHTEYAIESFRQKAFAGFSLGGLSALDTSWRYPDIFQTAGVFSGSLWWRSKAIDDGYDESTDRIMHAKIREGSHQPGMRFYVVTGSEDETEDRNGNGIIDSIDDAVALVEELENLGYQKGGDVCYLNYEGGKHDVPSWGRAMPHFLLWAFAPVAEEPE